MPFTRAVTRSIPRTFPQAAVKAAPSEPIDVDLARIQHGAYVQALRILGVEVDELPADDEYPDCCFVEDCALFHAGTALITNPGIASRRGEETAIRDCLQQHARIETMSYPATLEGGDCMRVENCIYIGSSARTNEQGIDRARQVFEPLGLTVVAVPTGDALHLKSVCSYLGNGAMLLAANTIPPGIFEGVEVIAVPCEEAYAANALSMNGSVLSPLGFNKTHGAIKSAGFEVICLDTSEIKKADGSLTCMSVLF